MVPLAADDNNPIIIDGSAFVTEPPVTAAESTIWEKELLIPHKL
jgi:hypothetical protein